MLRIDNISVYYGRLPAVQALSLEVREGQAVGLIGHNGAGKTSTLRAIAGLVKPKGGPISFAGRSLIGRAPEEIARLGITLIPEGRQIFSRLTVIENLRLGSTSRRTRRGVNEDISKLLERFPILAMYANEPASQLSGGEQQQLAIARALVSRPTLLLLDEPSLGLSPVMVQQVFEILSELRAEGMTILLVEQNVVKTLKLADYVYVLRPGGRIEFEGKAESLRRSLTFGNDYLGFQIEVETND
jgi:branched-chain amino acid transport system ATP-binding protein